MNTPGISSLDNYNDLSRLQSLKHLARSEKANEKNDALDAVAKQFESIFVSMMIKSMRDANKGFSEGNLLQSSETEFYQQMFDSQLAVTLSTNKGIGLAEVIKRQLSGDVTSGLNSRLNGNDGENSTRFDQSNFFNLEGYSRTAFPSLAKPERMQEAVAKIDEALQDLPKLRTDKIHANEIEMDFSSPDKFIESLYPMATTVQQQTGIDARLLLAQSALETGWGKHQILKTDGTPSFNLFGIKAQSDWQGDSVKIATTEYRQGIPMKEQATFRTYASYGESFQDYANFLKNNERYQAVLSERSDPKAFAHALQNSGYATDPEYGNKIGQIMDRYLPGASEVQESRDGQMR